MPNRIVQPEETAKWMLERVNLMADAWVLCYHVPREAAVRLITYRIQVDFGGFPREPLEEEEIYPPFAEQFTREQLFGMPEPAPPKTEAEG